MLCNRGTGGFLCRKLRRSSKSPVFLQDHVTCGYHYEAPRRLRCEDVYRTILYQEIVVFEDRLRKLFKCESDNRLPASQIADHEWFEMWVERSSISPTSNTPLVTIYYSWFLIFNSFNITSCPCHCSLIRLQCQYPLFNSFQLLRHKRFHVLFFLLYQVD